MHKHTKPLHLFLTVLLDSVLISTSTPSLFNNMLFPFLLTSVINRSNYLQAMLAVQTFNLHPLSPASGSGHVSTGPDSGKEDKIIFQNNPLTSPCLVPPHRLYKFVSFSGTWSISHHRYGFDWSAMFNMAFPFRMAMSTDKMKMSAMSRKWVRGV